MVLAASEVRANGTTYPVPAISAPRTCTVTVFWGDQNIDIATIEAGPLVTGHDGSGNPSFGEGLNPQFPRTVICDPETNKPDCPSWLGLTGPFLRWEYRFTPINESYNANPFVVSVASDVEIDATTAVAVSSPGAGDYWAGLGQDMYEARILRFDFGESETFPPGYGYYFTPVGFDPRVASAGAVVVDFGQGFCLLAGAGRSTLAPNQAAANVQTFTLPGTPCTIGFNVAPDGKVIPGTMQVVEGSTDCTITETIEPLTSGGKPIVYIGSVQFTQVGSCSYCWVNTYGGKTCSSCTTCCISNATGNCVAKSSIVPPNTCRSLP